MDRFDLTIDPALFSAKIEEFIALEYANFHRWGIVVPLSGGLDSTTVLTLCVRAVGREKVRALLLPEREGNPEATFFAKMAVGKLGVQFKIIDITRCLTAMGTYKFILSYLPAGTVKAKASEAFVKKKGEALLLEGLAGEPSALFRKGYSVMNSKHRIRMATVYKYAEEHNLMVVGCTHKTEDKIGLFVKFGVDDCADIMPIKNLFRTQVLQIARHLGVPEPIINRTPNPDIIPGVQDKYADLLHLSGEQIDMILIGLEKQIKPEEIREITSIPIEKIRQIEYLIHLTKHMRNPSMAPDLFK